MQRIRFFLKSRLLGRLVAAFVASTLMCQEDLSAGFLIFYAEDVSTGQKVLIGDNLTTSDQIYAPGTAFNGLSPTINDDDPLLGFLTSNQAIAFLDWSIDAGMYAEVTTQIDPDPEFSGVGLSFNVTNLAATGDPPSEIKIYATHVFNGQGTNIGSRLTGVGTVTDGATSTDLDFIGGMSLTGTAFDTTSAAINKNPTLTTPIPADGTNGINFYTPNAAPNASVGGLISLTVGGNFTLSPDQFLNMSYLSFESPSLQEAVPEPGIVVLLATAFAAGGGSHLVKRMRRRKSREDIASRMAN